MNSKDRLHIGHLIKAVFDESGLTVVEFARRIHCTHANVYSIFERNDIGIEQLVNISIALQHNFFEDVQRFFNLSVYTIPWRLNIDLNIKNLDSSKIERIQTLLSEIKENCK